MSHEFETGFFVRDPAWHTLGKVIDTAPSVHDGLVLSGMDWEVLSESLEPANCKGWKRLYRSDTLDTLHVCRDTWTPYQNKDAFEWFEPLIQDGDVKLDAAVCLRQGKRVAITAKIQSMRSEVTSGDEVEAYLVLYNSHEGGSFGVKFTGVRIVCANTLAIATYGDNNLKFEGDVAKHDKGFLAKHTKSIKSNVDALRNQIDIQARGWGKEVEMFKRLAEHPMSTSDFREYLKKVFEPELKEGNTFKDTGHIEPDTLKAYPTLLQNFSQGDLGDSAAASGTAWAGFNAVTKWITHERGGNAGSRLESNWFGESRKMVERAQAVARSLVS